MKNDFDYFVKARSPMKIISTTLRPEDEEYALLSIKWLHRKEVRSPTTTLDIRLVPFDHGH